MTKKLILILILIFILPVTVYALEDINQQVDNSLKNLDSELSDFSLYDFSKSLYDGENMLDTKSILEKIIAVVTKEVYSSFRILSKILIPILLYGILSALTLNKDSEGVSKIAFITCYAIICGTIIYVFNDVVELATTTITSIDVLTKSLVPILFTIVVTMGNITQATMVQPTVLIISQVLVIVINKVIFPLIMLSFAISITDNITDVAGLKNFGDLINKFVKWTLILLMTLFVAIVSAQNILGNSFDMVAVKGTKFAVSNFIPIVGGALSEGVETLGTSLMLIKNTTGIAGLAGVVVITFVPVIKIYAIVFMFYILSAISQPVTGEKFATVLNRVGNTASLLGVCVICMAVVFIITTAVVLFTNASFVV